jgi:hypothetical protein
VPHYAYELLPTLAPGLELISNEIRGLSLMRMPTHFSELRKMPHKLGETRRHAQRPIPTH